VNAANQFLLGGSGVDGAIHSAAGPDLLTECRQLGGCAVGDAKLTSAYNLPAKNIIHTVGPRWATGEKGERELLASCYRRCVEIAERVRATSIAFPCISTGVYRFPVEIAAAIATKTVSGCISESSSLKRVIFCCFSEADLDLYKALLHEDSVTGPALGYIPVQGR
jgi:O-acetyl-ADP-ribose deacetylase